MIGVPAVRFGDRDRLLGKPARGGYRQAAACGADREVGEARHLQVRPPDPARERERLLEVAAALVQVPRRHLRDAEIGQRRGVMEAAARPLARGLRRQRRLGRAEGLRRARDIATESSQPQPGPGQPELDRAAPIVGQRAGKALGNGDVRRALVVEAVGGIGRRGHEGELRVGDRRLGREGAEQVADCRHAAVEDQGEVVVGEQEHRVLPVAGGLGVTDRLDDVAVMLVPLTGDAMQRGDERRIDPPELHPEEVREHGVIAEPRAPDIECRHERAGVIELLKRALGPRATGQRIGQRAAHALEHGRPQQQIAHLGRLVVQDLGSQVARDRALAARELAHETFGIRVPHQQRRGEAQSADPALGALVKRGHAGVRQRNPDGVQQLARLLKREAQIRRPQFGQGTREAQPMQPQSHRVAREQHDAQPRRQPSQEALELRPALGRLQLVQIVDDEQAGLVQRLQTRDQSLDDPLAAKGGSLVARRELLAAREPREPIEHRQPEPPLVTLVAPHRHPAGVRAETGLGDPGAQQARLPTRRRRGDDGHGVRLGKPLEERRPQDRRLRRAPRPADP